MKKYAVIALIAILATICSCLTVIGMASAQEEPPPTRPYLSYIPIVMRYPVFRNSPTAEVYTGNLEHGEISISVNAPGCSSVYPYFIGIDRDIFPPSIYHMECIVPDFSNSSTTAGARVLIYLYSPMFWDSFLVQVYYPNGMLQSILIKGPYCYKCTGAEQ